MTLCPRVIWLLKLSWNYRKKFGLKTILLRTIFSWIDRVNWHKIIQHNVICNRWSYLFMLRNGLVTTLWMTRQYGKIRSANSFASRAMIWLKVSNNMKIFAQIYKKYKFKAKNAAFIHVIKLACGWNPNQLICHALLMVSLSEHLIKTI